MTAGGRVTKKKVTFFGVGVELKGHDELPTQDFIHVFMEEIPEHHHAFVLFDAPQNWQFNDLLVFQDAEIGMLE